jgi:hypothetical protein
MATKAPDRISNMSRVEPSGMAGIRRAHIRLISPPMAA